MASNNKEKDEEEKDSALISKLIDQETGNTWVTLTGSYSGSDDLETIKDSLNGRRLILQLGGWGPSDPDMDWMSFCLRW